MSDINNLYQLAMSIGTSLDLDNNCHGFFTCLNERYKINRCTLVLPDPESTCGDFTERFSLPQQESRNIPLSENINLAMFIADLEQKKTIKIDESSQGYEDIYEFFAEDGDEVLFYWLANLGFMYLNLGPYNLLMQRGHCDHILPIVKSFAQSIQGCLAHETAMAEIEKRKLAEEKASIANAAKSTFLANMSHEIRTPLNGIVGVTELLSESCSNDHQRNLTELIQKSSKILLDIVNDVLDFSKIQSEQFDLNPMSFNLRDAVNSSVSNVISIANQKKIGVIIDLPVDLATTYIGDSIRIKQILTNLLNNAVKFTDSGHVYLGLSTQRQENQTVFNFKVKDTGIGISTEDQKKLFNSFYQVDSSATKQYQGTGLGLAITKKLCNLMDGDISVSSEPGQGTEFQFSLCLENTQEHKSEDHKDSLKGFSVALIEDNAINRQIMALHLEHFGLEVHTYADPTNFVDDIRQEKYELDFIVLDMQMPKMSGIDVAKMMRNHKKYSQTPIMLVTSIWNLQHLEKEKKSTNLFDRKLFKPINMRDFYNSCHSLLEKTQQKVTPQKNSQPQNDFSELKCLLAEDNLINQKVISLLLKKFKITPDIVNNGQEALEAMEKNHYDLILMDIRMPVMGGMEALQHIRASGQEDLYIVALTANALTGDREKYLAAGFNLHMSKPIVQEDFQKLLAKVTQHYQFKRAI